MQAYDYLVGIKVLSAMDGLYIGILLSACLASGYRISRDEILYLCPNRTKVFQHVGAGYIGHNKEGRECTLTFDRTASRTLDYYVHVLSEKCALLQYGYGPYVQRKTFCKQDPYKLIPGDFAILPISSTTHTSNFLMEYCNDNVYCARRTQKRLSDTLKVHRQCGAIRHLSASIADWRSNCSVTLTRIPTSIKAMTFLLLPPQFNSTAINIVTAGNKVIPSGEETAVTPLNEELIIKFSTYHFNASDKGPFRWVVIFRVMSCKDEPIVQKGVIWTILSEPSMVGTKLNFTCISGYMKDGTFAECKVVGNEAKWIAADRVRCIVVPMCLSAPPTLSYAEYVLSGDNKTAFYGCIRGYAYLSEMKSICNSSNRETVPWTWSSPTSSCQIVNCTMMASFPKLKTELSDGSMEYKLGETFVYECENGYAASDGIIQCGINGDWNQTPKCKVQCRLTKEFSNITHGTSYNGRDVSYSENNFFNSYDCDFPYQKTTAKIKCQENGSWTATPKCDGCVTTPDINDASLLYRTASWAVYSCNDGFKIVEGQGQGQHALQCVPEQGRYIWRGGQLYCKLTATSDAVTTGSLMLAGATILSVIGLAFLIITRKFKICRFGNWKVEPNLSSQAAKHRSVLRMK